MGRGGTLASATGGGDGGAFSNEYSVSFDATDDYIQVPQDSSIDKNGSMSISAWFYADTLTSYRTIIAKRDASTDFQFAVDGSKFTFYNPSSGSFLLGTTSLSVDTWYHVCVSIDVGVTNGSKIYLNGNVDNQGTFATANFTTAAIRIGDNTRSRYWGGQIDEVAYFHTALSASEVNDLRGGVSAGTLGLPADIEDLNPVAWWRMGDGTEAGSGTTVYDMSDNSNNGTLTNGPTFSSNVPS